MKAHKVSLHDRNERGLVKAGTGVRRAIFKMCTVPRRNRGTEWLIGLAPISFPIDPSIVSSAEHRLCSEIGIIGRKQERKKGNSLPMGDRCANSPAERVARTIVSMIRNGGVAISIPRHVAPRTGWKLLQHRRAEGGGGSMKNGNRAITIPGGPVGPVRIGAPATTTFHSPPEAAKRSSTGKDSRVRM